MPKSSSNSANMRLQDRIRETRQQLEKDVEKLIQQEVQDSLKSDKQWEKLEKEDQTLRRELHFDRLKVVRKTKAIDRLKKAIESKTAECEAAQACIKANESKLVAVKASMEQIAQVHKDAIKKAKLADLEHGV